MVYSILLSDKASQKCSVPAILRTDGNCVSQELAQTEFRVRVIELIDVIHDVSNPLRDGRKTGLHRQCKLLTEDMINMKLQERAV